MEFAQQTPKKDGLAAIFSIS